MKSNRWKLFAGLAILILAIWGAYACLVLGTTDVRWSMHAQFGDAFGALNALFSGLALAGVIFALYLQMEELGLQREEMRNSREELAKTAQAQGEQVRLLAAQIDAMKAATLSEEGRRRHEIQPVFSYVEAPTTGHRMELKLRNDGALAKDLDATTEQDVSIRVNPTSAVAKGATVQFQVDFNGAPQPPIRFVLGCTDIDGNRRQYMVVTDPWKAGSYSCREIDETLSRT